MFGRVDFREDGKKKKKNKEKMRENFLEGVWLEGGEGKEMAWVRPIKKFSPHWGEKMKHLVGQKWPCASAQGFHQCPDALFLCMNRCECP